MAPSKPEMPVDPWGQVDDLDGTAHYRTLGLEPKASAADVKRAYRQLAKTHHPDKGGDPASFARIQTAFEVLGDATKRQVYDTWAKELQFRYVRTANTGAGGVGLGGEDMLLDEFENLGLHCDPATQLVVTCEVCRRPATKECWTCGMHICEFCTLKRHWKDGVPLHWPLVNSSHMLEKLGKQQLEKKRIADADRLAIENPNYRTESELRDIRAFKQAAAEIRAQKDRGAFVYDLRLARFYMWAQTLGTVYLACRVPTGYGDRELVTECSQTGLLVQAEDSPPVIDRHFAHRVDPCRAVESFRTADNKVCVLAIPKQELGEHWTRLFEGDSDGARCMQPPYTLSEGADDVLLEMELPFWIDPADVAVDFGERQLSIAVRNTARLTRTYWRNEEEESRRRDYTVIDPAECLWSLEDDVDGQGERCKLLVVTLARPERTEEEMTYKKGVRQDNRAVKRPGSMHDQGWRFFADDEDWYGLEDMLQALCFLEEGRTYVPAKPCLRGEESKVVSDLALLPAAVQQFVGRFREQQEEQGKQAAASGAEE